MTSRYDAIVVGAGHNGLVCAAYLARAGRKVLVLEASGQIGGAAATAKLLHGFKVSACAHLVTALHPKVYRDLKLRRHGLRYSNPNISTISLGPDGRHVTIAGRSVTGADDRLLPAADAAAYGEVRRRLLRFAAALKPSLGIVPPRLGTAERSDQRKLMRLGWSLRRLGRRDLREFLRVAGMNVADLLEEHFQSDLLMGALAFDAVLGHHLGPRSPNSVLTLLYRLAGDVRGNQGALGHPVGGMGSVIDAITQAATSHGAQVLVDSAVSRIVVENDQVAGVLLESGERIDSDIVVSNADPKSTLLDLVGPEHLDTGFLRRIRNIRMRGTVAKINLALDGLPKLTGLTEPELASRLVIAPSIRYLERAFDATKYGEYPRAPGIEITVPSIHDGSLAPDGKHVMSIIVQYAPYALKEGWDKARDRFADMIVGLIADHAPDLKSRVLARQVFTPIDLERQYRMTGGHWHHGELAIDQLLMLRPVPGAAQYAMPVAGLYLCGAGTHPGGGVSGAPGMNAAGRILATEQRK
jgi:phytoene dehydrogenase-like protein